LAEPGHDEFPGEKTAMEIERRAWPPRLRTGDPAAGCRLRGSSPAPSRYRGIAPGVAAAVFDGGATPRRLEEMARLARNGPPRGFYSLPGDLVRYDIRSQNAGGWSTASASGSWHGATARSRISNPLKRR
jgi:hypothetical protein